MYTILLLLVQWKEKKNRFILKFGKANPTGIQLQTNSGPFIKLLTL